jgi:hypothetical protein
MKIYPDVACLLLLRFRLSGDRDLLPPNWESFPAESFTSKYIREQTGHTSVLRTRLKRKWVDVPSVPEFPSAKPPWITQPKCVLP